jgi:hypothetical protein
MPLAPVIQAAIIGSGIVGGTQAIGSAFQSRATGQAANRRAQASRDAAQLQRQTAQDQLDFTKGQARWLRESSEADRAANYAQWLADQKNVELGGWDAAVNRRALATRGARQQYAGELAQGRNVYDRWQNQQQRLGTIGQLTGGAPRRIAGLQEAPYMPFDPLQRSARTYPDYVPGSTEIPPDPELAAAIAADQAERDAQAAAQAPDQYGSNQYGRRQNPWSALYPNG